MNTPAKLASTNYARMLILATRNFRQRQDAVRSTPHRDSGPKASGLSSPVQPGS